MKETISKAAFKLESFAFPLAKLDLQDSPREITLNNLFSPQGEYDASKGEFKLSLSYMAQDISSKKNIVEIVCQSVFIFASPLSFDEIPEYFYQNSIAILFPYIRAFVSSITLQANVTPLVLDTLNLSSLQSDLKKNTKEKQILTL